MPRADAEEIVFAWIRSDACGTGLKMMLDRASVQPLVDAVEKHVAAARDESEGLRKALHDAIARPMGVVPQSAQPFYDPQAAIRAYARQPKYGTPTDNQERCFEENSKQARATGAEP